MQWQDCTIPRVSRLDPKLFLFLGCILLEGTSHWLDRPCTHRPRSQRQLCCLQYMQYLRHRRWDIQLRSMLVAWGLES